MGRLYIFREFWLFVKNEKKWWLAPILLILAVLALFVIFAETSALAPFLYPLF
jgi:polyferredoxin